MERVRDESGIPNKHFINALSFKLNIKQNKIHLAKTSMPPCRFKVPCSQSIGPKNSKTSKDAVKYLSAEVGEIEKLFMGQILEKSHFGGGGETVHVEYITCYTHDYQLLLFVENSREEACLGLWDVFLFAQK